MFYAFYIDWEGLFNSIAAYPYFEVQWKSFENQWAEASKTKIIDCFQTPAGSRITNQNSSQGCLKLVLQILQPHIQTKKNDNLEIHFRLSTHEVYLFIWYSDTSFDIQLHANSQYGLVSDRKEKVCVVLFCLFLSTVSPVQTRCSEVELSPTELSPRVPGGPLPIYLL